MKNGKSTFSKQNLKKKREAASPKIANELDDSQLKPLDNLNF